MNNWFAITGKTPDLSLAELRALKLDVAPFSVSKQVINGKGDFPSVETWNRLGGVVKAGVWVAECTSARLEDKLIEVLSFPSPDSGRIDFGLSFYPTTYNPKQIERLSLSIKKQLKSSTKQPVRVYLPTDGIISPVITAKELLPKGGKELVIMLEHGQIQIGEVGWVHRFEDWSKREFGDKQVDAKSGLLPQKLARMMVNLTGLNAGDVTIYDPFCGDGTVLMEASELGFNILGSDISPTAVEHSKTNTRSDNFMVEDARITRPKISTSEMAIVTEPYLGPVNAEINQSNHIVNQLTELYYQSLKQWRSFLKPGAAVVMVFPVISNLSTFAKIVDRLSSLGYSTSIGPLRYERVGQLVQRDIVRLTVI
ncbi:MAG: DNA methyltransferase [Patescibacteria group bacterium]|jgi:hypothetical protein